MANLNPTCIPVKYSSTNKSSSKKEDSSEEKTFEDKRYIIGTSGYMYPIWTKKVVPPAMRAQATTFYSTVSSAAILKEYCTHFKAVEINCTRYKQLTPTQCANWYKNTPDDFIFSIKMPLYITHQKKLNDFEEWWSKDFYPCIKKLKHKLGVLLFQFKDMKCTPKNINKLMNVKSIIPVGMRCAFEFRTMDWYEAEKVLRKTVFTGNWVLVTNFVTNGGITQSDFGELKDGIIEAISQHFTVPFTYIRLHGSLGYCEGTYGSDTLITQVYSRCTANINFIFFNNTDTWEPFSIGQIYDADIPLNSLWPLSHYMLKIGTTTILSAVMDALLLSRLVT